MKYDSYNRQQLYKPGLQMKCRDRLHRIILSHLPIRSILEIGVGFGELANYCRRNGLEWIGIEPNGNLRNALTEEGYTVYDAVMPKFPALSESFDAIFAAHFIEHLDDYKEVTRFLEACKENLLSHDGRYLILLYPDIERCGPIFWHDYTHSFITTKKRIEDLPYDTDWRIRWSARYTACFFRTSGLIRSIGKIFPYFLLPERIALFARLSFLQHAVTIAEPADSAHSS